MAELAKMLTKRAEKMPADAKRDIVTAAKTGRSQIIDPKGSGMSGKQIANLAEKAGNG